MAADVNDQPVFWALLGLLAWAPLPLGSNRTLPVAIMVVWSVCLVLGMLWCWRKHASLAWAQVARFSWPLACLALLTAWVWLQTLPLPAEWLQLLSPEAWAVQADLPQQHISLDVHQTRVLAALSVCLACVFLVVVLTVRDHARLDRLALWLVLVAAVQAVVAIALYSVKAKYFVFYFEVVHDRVKGSYSYHNLMAGYLVLCLSVGIGLMLARLGGTQPAPASWKERTVRLFQFMLSPKMLLRMVLVVLVIALVLTRSRMGNSAFFIALLVVGLLTLALTRRSAPAMVALIVSLMVVDVVVVGTWVGLEKVVNRLEETTMTTAQGGREESVEARQDAARHAVDLYSAFPLTGTGAGTFYNSYIRYRTLAKGYFDHAHNDYIELAADLGAVGMVLLGGLVGSTVVVSAINLARRRSSLPRGMSFGVMMAVVAMAIHSTVDFNLQIPANAMLMVVVLAMGWVAYRLPSGRT